MSISLIGYRGSGKTSVARPLAARLGWNWADADEVLERQAGMTIREIFAAEGEPGFRRREREIIEELLARPDLVLAAGGGAILNADTRRDLRAAGPVVWLRAPAKTLEGRIAGDATTAARRPNLAGGGLSEIEELLSRRAPLYQECASLTIDTDGLTVDQIVDQILTFLRPLP